MSQKTDDVTRQAILRQGLTQYVGGMVTMPDYEDHPLAAAQITVASLCEEALKLTNVNGELNLYVAKPVFRAANYLLDRRIETLSKLVGSGDPEMSRLANDHIKRYKSIQESFNSLVENVKGD